MQIALFASSGTLSLGLLFWVLMIVSLVFGIWSGWPRTTEQVSWRPFGGHLLLWFLLFLLGWAVFGFPVGK